MLTAFLAILLALFLALAFTAALFYEWGRRDGAEDEHQHALLEQQHRADQQRWTSSLLESAARARDWDAWLDELAPDQTGPQQVIP